MQNLVGSTFFFRILLMFSILYSAKNTDSLFLNTLSTPTLAAVNNQEFFFSIQTNLVWLNVESPNSGSWRMQQKKENWFSWKMVYYEIRPTTTREEAYKVTLISFRIKPSLKVRSWGASILISITDERSRPIWNQFYMMS